MVNNTTAPATASFNTAEAQQILQALHDLRFTDKAMSATQGLAWGTLQQQFAAGKLGMYIAAPDDVYNVIVPTDKGNLDDIGMGPLPSLTGTPAGSLSGGNDFIFAKHDTPAQIAGRHQVDQLRGPDARRRPVQLRPAEGGRVPVGFPEPELFTGATGNQDQPAAGPVRDDQHGRTTRRSSTRRRRAPGEPTDAQAVYKTLDPVMLAVLTEPNANIPALLKTAATNVNTILANAGVTTGSRIRSDDSILIRLSRARGGRRPQPPAPRPARPAPQRTGEAMANVLTGVARRATSRARRARPAAAGAAAQGAAQRRARGGS